MTSDRAYRKALSNEIAIAELKRCAGTQFDPASWAVFVIEMEKWHQRQNDPYFRGFHPQEFKRSVWNGLGAPIVVVGNY